MTYFGFHIQPKKLSAFGLLLLLSTVFIPVSSAVEKKEVHIIVAADINGQVHVWPVFGEIVPMAFRHIEEREDILPGFTIVPHYVDSKVSGKNVENVIYLTSYYYFIYLSSLC